MKGTDTFTTGAAGAAPLPAAVVRPSRCDGWLAVAPAAAPLQGTGLRSARLGARMEPAVPVVRPWDLPLLGTGVAAGAHGTAVVEITAVIEPTAVLEPITVLEPTTDATGVPASEGGYADRTASTTPGALPPRDPLS